MNMNEFLCKDLHKKGIFLFQIQHGVYVSSHKEDLGWGQEWGPGIL